VCVKDADLAANRCDLERPCLQSREKRARPKPNSPRTLGLGALLLRCALLGRGLLDRRGRKLKIRPTCWTLDLHALALVAVVVLPAALDKDAGIDKELNLQPDRRGDAKAYQVRQVADAVRF